MNVVITKPTPAKKIEWQQGDLGYDTRTKGWFIYHSIEEIPIQSMPGMTLQCVRGLDLGTKNPLASNATIMLTKTQKDMPYLDRLEPENAHNIMRQIYEILNKRIVRKRAQNGSRLIGIVSNLKLKAKNNDPLEVARTLHEITCYIVGQDSGFSLEYHGLFERLAYTVAHMMQAVYGTGSNITYDKIDHIMRKQYLDARDNNTLEDEETLESSEGSETPEDISTDAPKKPKKKLEKLEFTEALQNVILNQDRTAAHDEKPVLNKGHAAEILEEDLTWLIRNIADRDDIMLLSKARGQLNRAQLILYGLRFFKGGHRPEMNVLADMIGIDVADLIQIDATIDDLTKDIKLDKADTYEARVRRNIQRRADPSSVASGPYHQAEGRVLNEGNSNIVKKRRKRGEALTPAQKRKALIAAFESKDVLDVHGWTTVETFLGHGEQTRFKGSQNDILSNGMVRILNFLVENERNVTEEDIAAGVNLKVSGIYPLLNKLKNMLAHQPKVIEKGRGVPLIKSNKGWRLFKYDDVFGKNSVATVRSEPSPASKRPFTMTGADHFILAGNLKIAIETDALQPNEQRRHRVSNTNMFIDPQTYQLMLLLKSHDDPISEDFIREKCFGNFDADEGKTLVREAMTELRMLMENLKPDNIAISEFRNPLMQKNGMVHLMKAGENVDRVEEPKPAPVQTDGFVSDFGDFKMKLSGDLRQAAAFAGTSVGLGSTSYALLKYLHANQGKWLPIDKIGENMRDKPTSYSNTYMAFIALRDRMTLALGPDLTNKILHQAHGVVGITRAGDLMPAIVHHIEQSSSLAPASPTSSPASAQEMDAKSLDFGDSKMEISMTRAGDPVPDLSVRIRQSSPAATPVAQDDLTIINYGDFVLVMHAPDRHNRTAHFKDTDIGLGPIQLKFLNALFDKRQTWIDQRRLFQAVWGDHAFGQSAVIQTFANLYKVMTEALGQERTQKILYKISGYYGMSAIGKDMPPYPEDSKSRVVAEHDFGAFRIQVNPIQQSKIVGHDVVLGKHETIVLKAIFDTTQNKSMFDLANDLFPDVEMPFAYMMTAIGTLHHKLEKLGIRIADKFDLRIMLKNTPEMLALPTLVSKVESVPNKPTNLSRTEALEIAVERGWCEKDDRVVSLFNLAAQELPTRNTVILSQVFLRKAAYRSTFAEVAEDMTLSVKDVTRLATESAKALLEIATPEQKRIIQGWKLNLG